MKPDKIYLTLDRLEWLLKLQKKLVIDKLSSSTYKYNPESTGGTLKSIDIDKDKFMEVGMGAEFPDDFYTLKEYLEP